MRTLLLLAFLPYAWAQTAASLSCPTGYQDGRNGYCYKPFPNYATRDVAVKQCNFDGGRLPLINNAFTNNLLTNLAAINGIVNIWLGLVCQTADKTSCAFDGAHSLNSTSYSNFVPGYLSPPNGPFGILSQFENGKWFTTGYANLSFICEVPIGNPPFGCSSQYQQFGDNCYMKTEADTASNTERFCNKDGAHMASIHSAAENNYTTSFAGKITSYYRIGLTSTVNNQLSWVDGSNYDYNNFALENNKYGSCVSVALTYNTLIPGQWISDSCDKAFPTFCKKPTEARYPPYNPPSMSSRNCPSLSGLNGGGTIYSPNYPYAYSGDSSSKQCTYILTATRDLVTVSFPEMNLESGSSIELFNDVTDTNPFVTLKYTDGLGRSYNSTGSAMKMVFSASYQNYNYGKWMAFYY